MYRQKVMRNLSIYGRKYAELELEMSIADNRSCVLRLLSSALEKELKIQSAINQSVDKDTTTDGYASFVASINNYIERNNERLNKENISYKNKSRRFYKIECELDYWDRELSHVDVSDSYDSADEEIFHENEHKESKNIEDQDTYDEYFKNYVSFYDELIEKIAALNSYETEEDDLGYNDYLKFRSQKFDDLMVGTLENLAKIEEIVTKKSDDNAT